MKRRLSWFESRKYAKSNGEIDLPPVLQSTFSPHNDLEKLLIDAGYQSASRPLFEQSFLSCDVFTAIKDDGQPEGKLEDASDLGIYTLVADDGEHYPVAFTALERGYDCFGPSTLLAKMSGRQMLEMVVSSGVWVNPSSAFGVFWKREDITRILSSLRI